MAVTTSTEKEAANLQHVEKIGPDSSKSSSSDHVDTFELNTGKHASAAYVERMGALRIDGDDLDHEHEPPVSYAACGRDLAGTDLMQMTFKRAMSLIAMGLLWTGSQIPLYLWGTSFCKMSLTQG